MELALLKRQLGETDTNPTTEKSIRMADIIYMISSSDDDDESVQIIGEKLCSIRAGNKKESLDLNIEKGKSDFGSEEKIDDKKIRKIVPTLLSRSVSMLKVDRKVPPTSAVNGSTDNLKAIEDSVDDVILLESDSIIRIGNTNGVERLTQRSFIRKSATEEIKPKKKEPVVITLDDEKDEKDDSDAEQQPDSNGNLPSATEDIKPKKKEPVVITLDDEKDEKDDSDAEQQPDSNGNLPEIRKVPANQEVIVIESEDESNDQNSLDGTSKQEDSEDDEVQVLVDQDISHSVETSNDDGAGSFREVGQDNKPEESKNQESNRPSSSESADCKPSTSSSNSSNNHETDELSPDGSGNLTEKLLNQLIVKISQSGFSKENQEGIRKKIMKYYTSASEEFTQSQKFIDQVKNLISEISALMALPKSKDMVVIKQITDKIQEFLGEFQRASKHLTPKLNKLYRMLDKLNRRIAIIEEQEVSSDSEYENAYTMLDRYRSRAVQVYNKIRQLEGKSNHADRLYLQEFIYAGVGPVQVQRALEKYYNKTKSFPDFAEVYKLIKRVNAEEKSLNYPPSKVHLIAQQVFADFGQKLKRRREYDDFMGLRSYAPHGIEDPAENDPDLKQRLESNKAKRRTEEDVLREFAMKEAAGEGKADNDENDEESSNSDSGRSENDKDGSESDKPKKVFMDTDEEMDYFENVEKRRRPEVEEEETLSKKLRLESEQDEDGALSKDIAVEEPETTL